MPAHRTDFGKLLNTIAVNKEAIYGKQDALQHLHLRASFRHSQSIHIFKWIPFIRDQKAGRIIKNLQLLCQTSNSAKGIGAKEARLKIKQKAFEKSAGWNVEERWR